MRQVFVSKIMDMIAEAVAENPVVLFSKSSCCMCHSIKTLLYSFGSDPVVYELDEHPDGQEMEEELKSLGCKPSVPALFIGQELCGGPKEILTLHIDGELAELLERIEP